MFQFENGVDLEWVMSEGPWMFNQMFPRVLRRWEVGVKLDPSSLAMMGI